MNVHLMRKIDFYMGVPLCFLLSVFLRLFLKKPTPHIQNILFMELSEMGSAILVDPAMRKAQRVLGAELYFVALWYSPGYKNSVLSISYVKIQQA